MLVYIAFGAFIFKEMEAFVVLSCLFVPYVKRAVGWYLHFEIFVFHTFCRTGNGMQIGPRL